MQINRTLILLYFIEMVPRTVYMKCYTYGIKPLVSTNLQTKIHLVKTPNDTTADWKA